jgi:hypothetical protein
MLGKGRFLRVWGNLDAFAFLLMNLPLTLFDSDT